MFFGHRFVAGHLFFDGLSRAHTTFGAAGSVNLLSDDVVFAGFDLSGFGALTGGLAADAEHGTAGGKAE